MKFKLKQVCLPFITEIIFTLCFLETIAGIRESAAPIRGPLIHLPITSECVVCYIEKRILAFLPCGHLTTCVPCGYSLNLCPMCRQRKEAMVAIHT